jgi:hypothetical protein
LKQRRIGVLRKLTAQTIVKEGKRRPKYCSCRALQIQMARQFALHASRWTVRRDLVADGFVAAVRQRVPTVFEGDYARRATFGHCNAILPPNVIFSDEKIFTTNDYTCRQQWVRDRRDMLPRERQRFTDRVMVWAAIGENFFVWKILPNRDGNPRSHAVLDALAYRRLCLPLVVPELTSGTPHRRFMQDNARPHTCKATATYLRNKHVDVIPDWPPRSPDLNPIETLWALVARDVAEQFPLNLHELRVAIDNVFCNWRDHRMNIINTLVASFPERCRRVARKHGEF